MPFFAVKTNPQTEKRGDICRKPERDTIDLSLFDQGLERVLQGTQFSIVILGISGTRWIAYAFDDSSSDDDSQLEYEEPDNDGFIDDCIVGQGIDANRPLWDPRQYWLVVIAHRVRRIKGEWALLMRVIERAGRKQVRQRIHKHWSASQLCSLAR